MEIGNEIIKCGNCNGFEYHIVATSDGIVVKCWTCGDKLMLKEMVCMIEGHVISSDDAQRLCLNDIKAHRIETICSRCGLDVIVRQNPTDEENYHITQLHSRPE